MPASCLSISGILVYQYPDDGVSLKRGQDAIDLIGAAKAQRADWVMLPIEKLDAEFFQLRSGLAGDFLQKFVTYGIHLVVLGDFSAVTATSTAFRDLLRESNRGNSVWFVANYEEMTARLEARHQSIRPTGNSPRPEIDKANN